MSPAVRALVAASVALAIGLFGPQQAVAAPPTAGAEGPLEAPAASEGELPGVDDVPGEDSLPSLDDGVDTGATEEGPGPGPDPSESLPVEPPPPTLEEPVVVRVAVGLSPELDGNKAEKAILDHLQSSVAASTTPKADLRRLRVGSSEPKKICREGRDDQIIVVGTMPDRADLVLLTRDCRIDQELGIRQAVAAEDSDLLGVLWSEHLDRVASGAKERRRARVSPKVRTGLIAGAAVLVIGAAVGLLIASAVQRETVVLLVAPR